MQKRQMLPIDERALWISHNDGILIKCLSSGEEYRYFPNSSILQYNYYIGKPSIFSWCNEVGQFITLYSKEEEALFSSYGYHKNDELFIPFCHEFEEPAEHSVCEKWNSLINKKPISNTLYRNQLHSTPYEEYTIVYALMEFSAFRGVEPLPERYLRAHCLEIPKSGLDIISKSHIKRTFYPMQISYDKGDLNLLGTYAYDDTTLLFIDNIGRTFIQPVSLSSCNWLKTNGFCLCDYLELPFSQGQLPADKDQLKRWLNLLENN